MLHFFLCMGWLFLRPKSVRNRFVIDVLVEVLCCHVAFWILLWVKGAFVIGLSQISSFFLLNIRYRSNGRGLLYFCVCALFITQSLGRLGSLNRFIHTSWVAVVTPTHLPKSVLNRCVIEVFSGGFCCHFGFLSFLWRKTRK